jgi:hypothetical protein
LTVWDVIVIAVQRWGITLLGGLLTGLLVFSVMHAKPVYLSQVQVVLLAPELAQQNALGQTSQSLIDLAGIVARKVQGADAKAQVVSEGVTIVGEGVRRGYSVTQPNNGGQWAYNFEDPVLDVQAVDSTVAGAKQQMNTALTDITEALTAVQDQQGVKADDRVRWKLSPSTPQITEQKGSNVRAVSVSAVIGLLVTGSILAMLGPRRKSRRRGRKRGTDASVPEPELVGA